jgi:hypothetical protein
MKAGDRIEIGLTWLIVEKVKGDLFRWFSPKGWKGKYRGVSKISDFQI